MDEYTIPRIRLQLEQLSPLEVHLLIESIEQKRQKGGRSPDTIVWPGAVTHHIDTVEVATWGIWLEDSETYAEDYLPTLLAILKDILGKEPSSHAT